MRRLVDSFEARANGESAGSLPIAPVVEDDVSL